MRKKLVSALVLATAGAFLANAGFSKCHCDHKVEFKNGQGQDVGFAKLEETSQGILIRAELQNLPEGWHGFHLHTTGKCDGPDFATAGGHYNPMGTHHGYEDPQGPHIGDLPNIYVGPDGKAKLEVFAAHVSLMPEGKNNLLDEDGTALVIHAKPDDYHSQPAGEAGARLACGVLR